MLKKTPSIRFTDHVKLLAIISACIIVAGLLFSVVFGVDLDISFKGGTQIKFSYVDDKDAFDTEGLKAMVDEALGVKTEAADATTYDGERQLQTVTFYTTESIDSEKTDAVEKAAAEKYADFELAHVSTNSLSPTMGHKFLLKCVVAVALAAILLLVYVAFRFRKIGGLSAGVFAIMALAHDMLIAYLAFVVFRIPLNDNFVAVMLSLLGYSLNDTIVIFDRVRENRRLDGGKTPIAAIVNKSVNQSFIRTLNTSITTVLAIGTVTVLAFINGMDAIISFALPMTLGVVSGFYSSVFLCTPLWSKWIEHKEKKAAAKPKKK
ncbi:MAG: protein translocase subunit SecF [Acutalibacteraceae bacterium]|jgi:preprotein translocase subunit SecF